MNQDRERGPRDPTTKGFEEERKQAEAARAASESQREISEERRESEETSRGIGADTPSSRAELG